MKKKKQSYEPTDWTHFFDDVLATSMNEVKPVPSPNVQEGEAEAHGLLPSSGEDVTKEASKVEAKAATPNPPAAGAPVWDEYIKLVEVYKSKKVNGSAQRVSIDPEIVESLRAISGYRVSGLVNAILKAFIITYRSRLKRMTIPKPKSLL